MACLPFFNRVGGPKIRLQYVTLLHQQGYLIVLCSNPGGRPIPRRSQACFEYLELVLHWVVFFPFNCFLLSSLKLLSWIFGTQIISFLCPLVFLGFSLVTDLYFLGTYLCYCHLQAKKVGGSTFYKLILMLLVLKSIFN